MSSQTDNLISIFIAVVANAITHTVRNIQVHLPRMFQDILF